MLQFISQTVTLYEGGPVEVFYIILGFIVYIERLA